MHGQGHMEGGILHNASSTGLPSPEAGEANIYYIILNCHVVY